MLQNGPDPKKGTSILYFFLRFFDTYIDIILFIIAVLQTLKANAKKLHFQTIFQK
jgi:hypothetical protein